MRRLPAPHLPLILSRAIFRAAPERTENLEEIMYKVGLKLRLYPATSQNGETALYSSQGGIESTSKGISYLQPWKIPAP